MYRDEPLDDEADLRRVVGDDDVDGLAARGGPSAVAAALDLLRLAQGWVDDEAVGEWFRTPLRRLEGRAPLRALAEGDDDLAAEALRSWLAAGG